MRPVSAEFLAALRGSHTMCSRARIVAPGQTGTDPDGTEIPILGGDVVLDANAEIRGSVDIRTSSDYWPAGTSDPATPYGNELFVERGITMGTGAHVWVSQGYYRIDTVDQDSIPGSITISGTDRMAQVVDAKLVIPVQFIAGVTLGSIVEQLVTAVLPDATFTIDSDFDTATLGRTAVAEEDRYKFLWDLVRSHGKIWYWDHTGALRITTPPDPTAPVYTVNSGQNGVLVQLQRKLTRAGMYNAVVATGEGADTGTPVKAVAYDADSSSPTYWNGPFGKVPRFYSSPFITTAAQAKSAASTMLMRALGLPSQVEFGTVPNPALEPEDPVQVVSTATGSRTHIIERISLPLVNDGSPLAATTRAQVSPDIQYEE